MIIRYVLATSTHFYRNYLDRRGWRWGNRYHGPGSVILFHQCIADLTKTRQGSPAGSHGARTGHAVTFALCLQQSFNYLQWNNTHAIQHVIHAVYSNIVISNFYLSYYVNDRLYVFKSKVPTKRRNNYAIVRYFKAWLIILHERTTFIFVSRRNINFSKSAIGKIRARTSVIRCTLHLSFSYRDSIILSSVVAAALTISYEAK